MPETMPKRDDIKRMGRDELERFLNLHLGSFEDAQRRYLGSAERNFCVNPWDSASLKEVMRAAGFRFKLAELPEGAAAAFDLHLTEQTPYQTTGEESAEWAAARAAAIAIVELTEEPERGRRVARQVEPPPPQQGRRALVIVDKNITFACAPADVSLVVVNLSERPDAETPESHADLKDKAKPLRKGGGQVKAVA